MAEERELIAAIERDPQNLELRLVYEDWLEDHSDPRAEFLKLLRAMEELTPDHVSWHPAEDRLAKLRAELDAAWVSRFEPPTRTECWCNAPRASANNVRPKLHRDKQDTTCSAWLRLLDLIEAAATEQVRFFSPLRTMSQEERQQIKTLPASIAKLTTVEAFYLNGSALVRVPPEIGAMSSLIDFSPHTSRELHWLPYEITRCPRLRGIGMAMEVSYGNIRTRRPFPLLRPPELRSWPAATKSCSVCRRELVDRGEHRAWITLRIGMGSFPLLVNACSEECIQNLPAGAEDHIQTWHRGGPDVPQLTVRMRPDLPEGVRRTIVLHDAGE
jgi:uncharacterized protein (TIGR02996 family)